MMTVNEIFYSIQGESTYAGLPCIFIRLTGCNLRCRYCDTRYAYEEGRSMSVSAIVAATQPYRCDLVEITGGEPLLQAETTDLARQLVAMGKQVLVETNGTMSLAPLPAPIIRIMDIKCPDSGEHDKTDWENIPRLRRTDNVKFVISTRADFDWALHIVQKYQLLARATILMSPVHGLLPPRVLSEWLLQAAYPIRLHLQLHKYIWPPNQRGV
jgi:7-carboxy-7-deazaguanine synthase